MDAGSGKSAKDAPKKRASSRVELETSAIAAAVKSCRAQKVCRSPVQMARCVHGGGVHREGKEIEQVRIEGLEPIPG